MIQQFDAYLDSAKAGLNTILQPFKSIFDLFSSPWISFGIIAVIFTLLLSFCIIKYRSSFKTHIKKPKTLVICAMMVALNIVLGFYTLTLSSYLRIGFGFMTQPVVTILYGPLVGCMTGMLQDILSFILNPTGGYIPAYTLCVGISGMIYGLMLYNKPVSLWRVFITKLIIVVFSNIILNSIALAPTVGSGFIGILPARVLKNLILLPIQTIAVYIIFKFILVRLGNK